MGEYCYLDDHYALHAVRSSNSATAAMGFLFILINPILRPENLSLAANMTFVVLNKIQKHSQFKVGSATAARYGDGGHFEIQYGGHRGQISGGPIS